MKKMDRRKPARRLGPIKPWDLPTIEGLTDRDEGGCRVRQKAPFMSLRPIDGKAL
jgi:hypothetical protein